jgi:hypothetical protein
MSIKNNKYNIINMEEKMAFKNEYINDNEFLIKKLIYYTDNLSIFVEEKNIEELKNIFFDIEGIIENVSWKKIVCMNFEKKYILPLNNILSEYKIFDRHLHSYENYFKTKVIINQNDRDMIYSIILSLTTLNTKLIEFYYFINKIIPNTLNENIFLILKIIKSDKLIYEDKIKKGIIVEINLRNNSDKIIKTYYEEHPEIYDFYYGH